MHVVADVQRVRGRDPHVFKGELEEPPVGLAVAVVAGDDDRIEVSEQTDSVQLGACICALRIGDNRERVLIAMRGENLLCVRVHAELSSRNAA